MYFDNKRLCEDLRPYRGIIIYGMGVYARQIWHQLVQHGLEEQIVCFTQTELKEEKTFCGIPVRPVSSEEDNHDGIVILVAVSKLYADEIKEKLSSEGYHHVIFLTDYEINYRQYRRMKDAELSALPTFEEHCNAIADWYINSHTGTGSKEIIVQKLLDRGSAARKKTDGNLIVMICGLITARTIRIIGALKRKKYHIVMLSYFDNVFSWYFEELQKADVSIYQCQSVEEMLYRALQYTPLVYYYVPRWGDCLWAEIMIMNKQYFGKIVLELYDVLNGGYLAEEDKLVSEKYALEHADGVVWRWFSEEYLQKKGFQFQGKSVQFLDFCSLYDENEEMNYDPSDTIKLCFVTGFGDEYIRERYTPLYAEWASIGEILERIGNREDCSIHFYAGALSRKSIKCCQEYEKKYHNFKFYVSVKYDELTKKLGSYDFGCDLAVAGQIPEDDTPIGGYYGSIYENSIRNTYFEYIMAGLPVITTFSSKMWKYLAKYDIAIPMNLENLDIDYLKKNRQYYKEKIRFARRELVIDNQIDRLIDFFREVSYNDGPIDFEYGSNSD